MRRSKLKKDAWHCIPCNYKEELAIETAAGRRA